MGNCHLPEVDMKVKKNDIMAKCKACGWAGELDSVHRLAAFIRNNPPDASGLNVEERDAKEGKKDRRQKKNKDKDDEADEGSEDEDEKEEKKKKKKKKSKKEKKAGSDDEDEAAK